MEATSSSAVISQMKLLSPSIRDFRSGLQIRTYMSPCRYNCKKSLFSSYTISASFDGQPGKNSGLSYSQPDATSNVVRKIDCSAATHTSIFSEDLVNDSSHVAEEKIGVLLLNLGGPDTLNDVQPFLFNLFADPDIIRLPRIFRFLQRPLAQLISTLRAPKSKEGYASIGGGSPLRKITDEQASAIKLALEAKHKNVSVYVGMRYWYPFTEEAVDQDK